MPALNPFRRGSVGAKLGAKAGAGSLRFGPGPTGEGCCELDTGPISVGVLESEDSDMLDGALASDGALEPDSPLPSDGALAPTPNITGDEEEGPAPVSKTGGWGSPDPKTGGDGAGIGTCPLTPAFILAHSWSRAGEGLGSCHASTA